MSLIVSETSQNFTQRFDLLNFVRTFKVVAPIGGTIQNPTYKQVIQATGLKVGEPDGTEPITNPPLLPSQVDVQRNTDEGPDVFEVTWTYTIEAIDDQGGNEVFFDELSSSITAVNIDIWRTATTPGAKGNIGGNSVDSQGYPITATISQQNLTISRTYFSLSQIPIVAARGLVGVRNSGPFQGGPSGSVLFKGLSFAREGLNRYKGRFDFVLDPLNHQRQAPVRDPDGRPKKDSNGQAADVRWRQPFPTTASFAILGVG